MNETKTVFCKLCGSTHIVDKYNWIQCDLMGYVQIEEWEEECDLW